MAASVAEPSLQSRDRVVPSASSPCGDGLDGQLGSRCDETLPAVDRSGLRAGGDCYERQIVTANRCGTATHWTASADSTRSRYTDFRLEVNLVVAEIREIRPNRVIVDLGYLDGCVLSFSLVRNCDSEQTATS